MSTYWYVENGQKQGPVSLEQLRELHRARRVTAATLVWRHGLSSWKPLAELFPPRRADGPGTAAPVPAPVARPESAAAPAPAAAPATSAPDAPPSSDLDAASAATPAEPGPAQKRCPACAELIHRDAVKCKHCGERLDRPRRSLAPSLAPARRRLLVRTGLGVAAAAVLAGAAGASVALVPETRAWVSLHRDVEWHRAWQDARVERERDRVVDLYRQLAEAKPADGDLGYLALRSLPDGDRKLAAFQDLARRFPANPWVLFGLAASVEDDGSRGDATELRQKAIELFGAKVPGLVLGRTALGLARDGDGAKLKELYARFGDRIRASADASALMARAALVRGDLDGMAAWEAQAERLGAREHALRDLRKAMETVGLRPDLTGATAAGTGVMFCEIVGFSAEARQGGTDLAVQVDVTSAVATEDLTIAAWRATLVPSSGSKLEGAGAWTRDIPPGKHEVVTFRFFVPAGSTADKLVIDSGRVRLPYRTPIVATFGLAPDARFKVEDPIRP